MAHLLRLAVAQAIVHAYTAAHEAIAKYEPLRPIHEFCQSYDPVQFKVSTGPCRSLALYVSFISDSLLCVFLVFVQACLRRLVLSENDGS